ncbi:unnamed protein product [Lasius platythorax]|uniref:Secreted protein n=1 Tax=Lasius platythorax TaxID=488582 RepID=A0AAV2NU24_9HYME
MKSPCSPYNRYAMFRTLTSVGTAGLLLGEMLEALSSRSLECRNSCRMILKVQLDGATPIGLEARPVNPPVRSLKAPSDRDYSR